MASLERLNEARAAPRDIPVSWSASHLRFGKRGQIPHMERREPRRPNPGLRMPVGVMPLVNKKGKKSLVFVDDISMPIDEAGFIREVIPSNLPRIDLGGKPGNAWRTPMRKNFPLPTQDQRWREARAMYNHGEELDDLEAWGFKRADAPVGRGPGGKKRGRNWKNGKGRKTFGGAETCRPIAVFYVIFQNILNLTICSLLPTQHNSMTILYVLTRIYKDLFGQIEKYKMAD